MKFLRTAVGLCAGFNAYRTVRDRPFSSSVKYLLQLMTLLALALMLSLIPPLLAALNRFSTWAEATFPPFAIAQGGVVSPVAQPHISGDDQFRVILDTTGAITEADPGAAQGLLIGAREYLVWVRDTNAVSGVHQRRASFQGFPDGEVDAEYLRRLVRWVAPVALPLAFVIALLLGMLIALIQAYLFSIVGSLLEPASARKLSLTQLLNIAIHAVTPGAVIVTAYMMMQLSGVNLWLVYLIAYGVFLVGATNACRTDETAPPILPDG